MAARTAPSTPLWVFAAIAGLLISGIAVPEGLGATLSGYTSVSNYLSELGAVGMPTAKTIAVFGFLPVSIFTVLILSFVIRHRLSRGRARAGAAMLMIGLAVGYLAAVLFPCDMGCPVEGSGRQAVHNLAALVSYPLGAAGLLLLSTGLDRTHRWVRWLCVVAGLAMIVGFVLLAHPDFAPWRGAFQRAGDYSAFLAIAAVALGVRPASSVEP